MSNKEFWATKNADTEFLKDINWAILSISKKFAKVDYCLSSTRIYRAVIAIFAWLKKIF